MYQWNYGGWWVWLDKPQPRWYRALMMVVAVAVMFWWLWLFVAFLILAPIILK